MKRRHFEWFRPLCPVCLRRTDGTGRESPLAIGTVCTEVADDVLAGVLVCTADDCMHEFPILDGIPLLLGDLPTYLASHLPFLMFRDDLPGPVATLMGDACGPGSNYDLVRQQIGAYTWDHYADLDPSEPQTARQRPASCVRLLQQGWEHVTVADGPIADIGCSSGRTTFELAQRVPDVPVLGIDLNFGMLRTASRVLRSGLVEYDRRSLGLVYERRRFAVEFPGAERVDFWACDAGLLPFRAGLFSRVNALNVLDCVSSPLQLLQEIERSLRPGGWAFLTTPFDWNPAATPLVNWLGGHSQRGPGGGSGVELLRSLVTAGSHPQGLARLHAVREWETLPWSVRCHDRSVMEYDVYGLLLQKQGTEGV